MRLAKSQGQPVEQGIVITLPVNNNELAAQIGTVRELVSRNLNRLQSGGLTEVDGRTVVVADIVRQEAELADAS